MQRQECAYGNQQIKPGDGDKYLSQPHGQVVNEAAVQPGDGAQNKTGDYGERRGKKSGKQRYLPAIKQAGELVAAKAVRAHQRKMRRGFNTEQVPVGMKDSQNCVSVSARDESDSSLLRTIRRVFH